MKQPTQYGPGFVMLRLHRLLRLRVAAIERHPVCYISGPMTGLPEFNRHSFLKAHDLLARAGWLVQNPVKNDAEKGISLEGLEGTEDFDFAGAMATDLAQVCESDAVFVLPGWEESKGAKLEVHVAHEVDVPVFSLLSCRLIEPKEEVVTMEYLESLGPLNEHLESLGRLQRHPGSQRFHELLKELGELHDRKQQDYGTRSDPFANVRGSEEWGIPPWIGALVRLNDKVVRLKSMAKKGKLVNESAEDSMRDIAVYAVIALVLYEEEKEEAEAA